jgi:hypothetical protein
MARIEMTELERHKLVEARRQSIPCTNGWRPIETAPKDGTIILIYNGFRQWLHDLSIQSNIAVSLDTPMTGIKETVHQQPFGNMERILLQHQNTVLAVMLLMPPVGNQHLNHRMNEYWQEYLLEWLTCMTIHIIPVDQCYDQHVMG